MQFGIRKLEIEPSMLGVLARELNLKEGDDIYECIPREARVLELPRDVAIVSIATDRSTDRVVLVMASLSWQGIGNLELWEPDADNPDVPSIHVCREVKSPDDEDGTDVEVTTYPVGEERLEQDYTYHAPTGNDQILRYKLLRDQARTMASNVMQFTPASREQSLALTRIEEAVMWANAAIARNEH